MKTNHPLTINLLIICLCFVACSPTHITISRYPSFSSHRHPHLHKELSFLGLINYFGTYEFEQYEKVMYYDYMYETDLFPHCVLSDRDSVKKIVNLLRHVKKQRLSTLQLERIHEDPFDYENLQYKIYLNDTLYVKMEIPKKYKFSTFQEKQSRKMFIEYKLLLQTRTKCDTIYLGPMGEGTGINFMIKNGQIYMCDKSLIWQIDTLLQKQYLPLIYSSPQK